MDSPGYLVNGIFKRSGTTEKWPHVVMFSRLLIDGKSKYGYGCLVLSEAHNHCSILLQHKNRKYVVSLNDKFNTKNILYMSFYMEKIDRLLEFFALFSYSDGTILRLHGSRLVNIHQMYTFMECVYNYNTFFFGSDILSTHIGTKQECIVLTRLGKYNISENNVVSKIDDGILPLEGRYEILGIQSCVSYRPVIYEDIVGFLILDNNRTLSFRSVESQGIYSNLDGIMFTDVIGYSEMFIGCVWDDTRYYFAQLLIYRDNQLILAKYDSQKDNTLKLSSTIVYKTKGEPEFSCCYQVSKPIMKNARNV